MRAKSSPSGNPVGGTGKHFAQLSPGLECGIIQGAYPDMDMVSIGPDLEYPHSPDERVNIHSVQNIWEFITATLERI